MHGAKPENCHEQKYSVSSSFNNYLLKYNEVLVGVRITTFAIVHQK